MPDSLPGQAGQPVPAAESSAFSIPDQIMPANKAERREGRTSRRFRPTVDMRGGTNCVPKFRSNAGQKNFRTSSHATRPVCRLAGFSRLPVCHQLELVGREDLAQLSRLQPDFSSCLETSLQANRRIARKGLKRMIEKPG